MKGSGPLLPVLVVAVLLLGTSGANAADSLLVTATSDAEAGMTSLPSDQGADIYGVGGGKAMLGLWKFDFSAHEGPNGDFGHVSVTETTPLGQSIVSYYVNVNCVHVMGTGIGLGFDHAVIRGVVQSVSPVPNGVGLGVGDYVVFLIKDGGNPSIGPVDDFWTGNADAGIASTLPPQQYCKMLYYSGSLNNVTSGNVNIKGP